MKFFLILFLIPNISFAQHEGHPHAQGENCNNDTLGKTASELSSTVESIVSQTLSPEFCKAINQCNFLTDSSDCGHPATYTLEYPTVLANGSCGLSIEEYAALRFYSLNGYTCINQFLWKMGDRPTTQYIVDRLNSGLAKLPKYQGFVFRRVAFPPHIDDLHQEGSIVQYDAFTSTSTNRNVAETNLSMLLIHSSNGRPIMGLSAIQAEAEVLFQSNSRFKVLDKKGNNPTYYILREISGNETILEAEAADKKVLDEVAKNQNVTNPGFDTWSCPVSGNVPSILPQMNIPRTHQFGDR